MKLDSYLTEYTEINLKWIIDMKVTTKIITVLEKNIITKNKNKNIFLDSIVP